MTDAVENGPDAHQATGFLRNRIHVSKCQATASVIQMIQCDFLGSEPQRDDRACRGRTGYAPPNPSCQYINAAGPGMSCGDAVNPGTG